MSSADSLATAPASATLPPDCLPPCPLTARPDSPDPAVHTLPQLSESPKSQPPSPPTAPRKSPLEPLPLHHNYADGAPTDSLAGSTLHSSVLPLHIPPLSHPASAALAPQITPVHTSLADIPPPCDSIPLISAVAPPLPADLSLLLAAPDPLPSAPAPAPDAPASSSPSPLRIDPCCKPSLLAAAPRLP